MFKKLLFTLMLLASGLCHAQTVKIIVGWAPGGIGDIGARALEKSLSQRLPYNFVIDYMPGAGGVVAVNHVAKLSTSETVLVMISPPSVLASTGANAKFDLFADFQHLHLLCYSPVVLVANKKSPIQTWQDLIKTKDTVFYGSAGFGTSTHLTSEILRQQLNKDFQPVFYKGESSAFVDVLANNVQMMSASMGMVGAHVNNDQLNFLAITGHKRHPKFPQVPTFSELGVQGLSVSPLWLTVAANRGANPQVVNRIKTAMIESHKDPAEREAYQKLNLEVDVAAGWSIAKFLADEQDKLRKLNSHIQLQK